MNPPAVVLLSQAELFTRHAFGKAAEAIPTTDGTAMHPYLEHAHPEMPVAYAHRGYSSVHPENTMAAFQAAVDLGYLHVETDVHATADGRVAAFHDERLDRVTDMSGAISELPWHEISKARVGREGKIPLLAELLSSWEFLRVNIDPKHDGVVAPLLDLIRRENAWDRVCVGSFSGKRLNAMRASAGHRLCTSMGPMEVFRLRAASIGLPSGGFEADCIQVPVKWRGLPVVDRAFVRCARKMGLPVHVWTVNEAAEMERLLDIGVDAIMTDEALLLKQTLKARGEWADRAPGAKEKCV